MRDIFTFEMIISASGCPSNTGDNIYSEMNTHVGKITSFQVNPW